MYPEEEERGVDHLSTLDSVSTRPIATISVPERTPPASSINRSSSPIDLTPDPLPHPMPRRAIAGIPEHDELPAESLDAIPGPNPHRISDEEVAHDSRQNPLGPPARAMRLNAQNDPNQTISPISSSPSLSSGNPLVNPSESVPNGPSAGFHRSSGPPSSRASRDMDLIVRRIKSPMEII